MAALVGPASFVAPGAELCSDALLAVSPAGAAPRDRGRRRRARGLGVRAHREQTKYRARDHEPACDVPARVAIGSAKNRHCRAFYPRSIIEPQRASERTERGSSRREHSRGVTLCPCRDTRRSTVSSGICARLVATIMIATFGGCWTCSASIHRQVSRRSSPTLKFPSVPHCRGPLLASLGSDGSFRLNVA